MTINPPRPSAAALAGTWQVDLRPTPDAAPYYQHLVVDQIDGDTFSGTFYGAPIQNGRINAAWDALHFAWTSEDGSGVYHHTGKLLDDRIEGTSHALGRQNLWVWRATRVTEPPIND